MVNKIKVSNQLEPFYMSRRFWGMLCAAGSVVCANYSLIEIATGLGILAAGLGGISYYKPK